MANKTVEKRIKRRQEEFIDAYKELWTVSTATSKIKIGRCTYYDWIAKYPNFQEKMDKINAEHNDYVESKLIKAIENDNLRAIMFYLKNKHPAYKPKSEVTVETENPLASLIAKIYGKGNWVNKENRSPRVTPESVNTKLEAIKTENNKYDKKRT